MTDRMFGLLPDKDLAELRSTCPSRPDNVLEFKPRPYQTSDSTINAFWYVVRNYDDASIEKWLDEHPRDRLYLIDLLDAKNAK